MPMRAAASSAARVARRTFSTPIFIPGCSIVGAWMTLLGEQLAGVGHHRGADRDGRQRHGFLLDAGPALAGQGRGHTTAHNPH